MHHDFPTDRRSLIRYVRSFVALLAEQLRERRNVSLPNGLTMGGVLRSLALHEAYWDATARDLGLPDDEAEPEWFAEIAETLREVFDELAGPSHEELSPN